MSDDGRLIAELRAARDAERGMYAIFQRELAAGSSCLPLVRIAMEALGISLMQAKVLSDDIKNDSEERFDARLLSTIDPIRWPPPRDDGPLGVNRAFDAKEPIAPILREARDAGADHSDLSIVLRTAFGLSRNTADSLVARLAIANDADFDMALRDAVQEQT